MKPNIDPQTANEINNSANPLFSIISEHLHQSNLINAPALQTATTPLNTGEILNAYISNIIGLLIQCYDSGRGLLCNALETYLDDFQKMGNRFFEPFIFDKFFNELQRHRPVFHNTKRILWEDYVLDGVTFKCNKIILLVLASANRDEKQFQNPNFFDINRPNNKTHLTFSYGAHECIAHHFSKNMTKIALQYLFQNYPKTTMIKQTCDYEPLANARLRKHLLIHLR